MASWDKGTERGLTDPIQQTVGDINDPELTFHPDFPSDAAMREKARSSGYGTVVAHPFSRPPKPEENFPFRPQLPQDGYRGKAASSGYGKTPVVVKRREPEKPDFTPQIKLSSTAKRIREQARSAGYGRTTVTPRKKDPPKPDRKSFSPRVNKNHIWKSAQSSGYGRKSVEVKRPQSAPSAYRDPTREKTMRYTLLKDKSKPPPEPLRTSSKPEFRLDCVVAANAKKVENKREVEMLPQPKLTAKQRQLRDDAPSSGYALGTYEPPVAERPQQTDAPRPIKLGGKSALYEAPPPPPANPMKDKVRGNYLNDYQPPVAERRPITPSSPPRIRGGKDSVLDKPLADHVRTGVSKLTFEKVTSSGYTDGAYSPLQGEKLQPREIPRPFSAGGKSTTLKPLEQLDTPVNALTQQVTSKLAETLNLSTGRYTEEVYEEEQEEVYEEEEQEEVYEDEADEDDGEGETF